MIFFKLAGILGALTEKVDSVKDEWLLEADSNRDSKRNTSPSDGLNTYQIELKRSETSQIESTEKNRQK